MPSDGKILFNTGEGLVADDLNLVQTQMGYRIFDFYQYHKSVDLIADNATYISNWTSGDNIKLSCYSLGGLAGGFEIDSSTDITMRPGILAQWVGSGGLTLDENNFLHYQFGENEFQHTFVLPSVSTRYDLIELQLAEAAGSSESRDFKDATTGALTTVSTNKRTNISATVQVITGVEGGGLPSVSSGFVPIAYVEISTSQVENTYSVVRPVAEGVQRVESLINKAFFVETGSPTTGGRFGVEATSGSDIIQVAPPLYAHDGYARIMGVRITGRLTSPTLKIRYGVGSAFPNEYEDFSSAWTAGGGVFDTLVKRFRPEATGELYSIWGGAANGPHANTRVDGSGRAIFPALQISFGASGDILDAVEWEIYK